MELAAQSPAPAGKTRWELELRLRRNEFNHNGHNGLCAAFKGHNDACGVSVATFFPHNLRSKPHCVP